MSLHNGHRMTGAERGAPKILADAALPKDCHSAEALDRGDGLPKSAPREQERQAGTARGHRRKCRKQHPSPGRGVPVAYRQAEEGSKLSAPPVGLVEWIVSAPDGFGAQVVTAQTARRAWEEANPRDANGQSVPFHLAIVVLREVWISTHGGAAK